MINAQHENAIEPRTPSRSITTNFYALNTLQSDYSSIADSCNCWLKLVDDELLSPYKEKVHHRFLQTMTPFHFLAFCLHPKYRGRGLGREQLESHQLVSSKWHSRLRQICFHNICSVKIFSKK